MRTLIIGDVIGPCAVLDIGSPVIVVVFYIHIRGVIKIVDEGEIVVFIVIIAGANLPGVDAFPQ